MFDSLRSQMKIEEHLPLFSEFQKILPKGLSHLEKKGTETDARDHA